MRTSVRNLASGQAVDLPVHRPKGAEWYSAAVRLGLRDAATLTLQRNSKPLRGTTVLRVMHAYAELDSDGSGVYVGQAALGEHAGVSTYTARRAQQWLIENGWLIVVSRFKPNRQGWSVILAIPEGECDSFEWGEIHPPRRRPWTERPPGVVNPSPLGSKSAGSEVVS